MAGAPVLRPWPAAFHGTALQEAESGVEQPGLRYGYVGVPHSRTPTLAASGEAWESALFLTACGLSPIAVGLTMEAYSKSTRKVLESFPLLIGNPAFREMSTEARGSVAPNPQVMRD